MEYVDNSPNTTHGEQDMNPDMTQACVDNTEYFICPFCKEEDYDLIGLKCHFERGYCEEYNQTEEPSA